jgi:predicted N-acyltransferase
MQIAMPSAHEGMTPLTSSYTTERSFTAAKYEEAIWDRLLPGEAESYRYHLAFEMAKVEGFKTGYAAVKRSGVVVCLAPYFVTDYRLDSTIQGALKRGSNWLNSHAPHLFNQLFKLKLLCVGSAVTDSAKLGLSKDHAFDIEIITALNAELELVAEREGASIIAFKDILESDLQLLETPLKQSGFSKIENMPIARNLIGFKSFDEYLATLSYSTRKDFRRKLRIKSQITIEEYNGTPPDLQEIYQLYSNCYEQSELKFEKLTPEFFESVAALMPFNCRYVLYRAQGKLIGFNLLLHRDGVLLDKYIGLDYTLSRQYNLYFLSWAHNIEMCIRDGLHTYQSGQAAYETKIRLGSKLEQTYIFFRHRNRLINPALKLIANTLAYANFDDAVKKTTSRTALESGN